MCPSPYGTGSDPNPAKHPLALSLSSLCFSLVGDNKQSFILPLGRRVQRKRRESAAFPSSSHLVKQLLSGRVGLDGELQLRVHGGDAHVDLQGRTTSNEKQPSHRTCICDIKATPEILKYGRFLLIIIEINVLLALAELSRVHPRES